MQHIFLMLRNVLKSVYLHKIEEESSSYLLKKHEI